MEKHNKDYTPEYRWEELPQSIVNETAKKLTGYEDVIEKIQELQGGDCDVFNEFSVEEQDKRTAAILEVIRSINIFPVYYYTKKGIIEEIKKCRSKKDIHFEDGSLTTQSSIGILILDFLFPNLHRTRAGTKEESVYDRFYDDEKLKVCIKSYASRYKINNLRTLFFSIGRFLWATAINFSPMRARAIYEELCPKKGGVIYDYSCGFGGRMLGCLSSPNQYYYIGCEPNRDTNYNLDILGSYITTAFKEKPAEKRYELHLCGSEEMGDRVPEKSVDLAFSCPPFFKLERYSDEETQSTVKFPVYKDWLEGYVRPTIRNCKRMLKDDGLYAVDIANFSYNNTYYSIVEDWCRVVEEEGFELVKSCPINSRARKKVKSPSDTEQVYVFKKILD